MYVCNIYKMRQTHMALLLRRRAAGRPLLHDAQQQTRRTPLPLSNDGTDRQTDGRTDTRPLHRPCCRQSNPIQSNSSMHHYDCIALCKDISLRTGIFCTRSLASCIPRSSEDRSSPMLQVHAGSACNILQAQNKRHLFASRALNFMRIVHLGKLH